MKNKRLGVHPTVAGRHQQNSRAAKSYYY